MKKVFILFSLLISLVYSRSLNNFKKSGTGLTNEGGSTLTKISESKEPKDEYHNVSSEKILMEIQEPESSITIKIFANGLWSENLDLPDVQVFQKPAEGYFYVPIDEGKSGNLVILDNQTWILDKLAKEKLNM
jgi:hypothetical protein